MGGVCVCVCQGSVLWSLEPLGVCVCVCVCVYVSRGSILCSVVPCAFKCVCVYVRGVFCDPLSLWVWVCDRVCVCVCVSGECSVVP